MIETLRISEAGIFRQLSSPLTEAIVEELFEKLRATTPNTRTDIFRHVRVREGDALWSAISFQYDQVPTFLPDQNEVREVVCGFLMLVEYANYAVIFKSRLDLPSAFHLNHLEKIPDQIFNTGVAKPGAVFEKVRLRQMTLANQALRTKSLEADDLSNTIAPAASSRFVAQGYSLRNSGGHYSATPRTGRIAHRSEVVGHLEAVAYAMLMIEEIETAPPSPDAFIQNFAQPIDFSELREREPTAFAADVAWLSDKLFSEPEIRLVRRDHGLCLALTIAQVNAILRDLGSIMEVHGDAALRELRDNRGITTGKIRLNQSRISLRSLLWPSCMGVEVERSDAPFGEDPERMGLCDYINTEARFIVLFDDLSLAYIDGELYRDGGLIQGSTNLLAYLRPEPALARVTSEKGRFSDRHQYFDQESTFSVVASVIASDDQVLVCDDLNNEWADFIGLDNSSSPKRITFYHAKHGPLSLGATPFHVAISQAIKNLKNMAFPRDEMPRKIGRWQQNYSNDGSDTQIARTIRFTNRPLSEEFEEARNAPDTSRRVMIVTSSLSKQAVEAALDDIRQGGTPSPHFVQLYWLLMSFFGACVEVNAHGYVICQP
jgi:hypothetical protein